MAEISGPGKAQGLAAADTTVRPPVAPPPVTPAAPAAPAAQPGDQRQAAATGRAAPVASLVETPPPVDFRRLMRGFAAGQDLEVSASGFFGSSMVGGFGKVEAVSTDRFRIDLHVRAPGHNSDKPMEYRRDGDQFIGADGARWNGSLSADGHSLTLTDAADSRKRIRLTVDQPGRLQMTTWGFGGDGKPLTIAVTH
jgi:hypothetical protein